MSVSALLTAFTAAGKDVSENFNGLFSFVLSQNKKVSAGIYDQNGEEKLATLFNMENRLAGSQTAYWNGKDDFGNDVASGAYKAKIVTSNIQSSVVSVVGNSSVDLTSNYKHKTPYKGMYITNDKIYLCGGYSERQSQQKQTSLAEPNRLTNEIYHQSTQSTYMVCVDSVQGIIYWHGNDPGQRDSWVFGGYVSADCNPNAGIVPFSAGIHIDEFNPGSGGYSYDYAVAVKTADESMFGKGFDVQQGADKFLFLSRGNILQVLNNTTGELLHEIPLNNPGSLKCVDDDRIWIVQDTVVNLYAVNGDGTIGSAPIRSISGFADPKINISPLTGELVIGDNKDLQVKFYNQNTGALSRTFGVLNGNRDTVSLSYNKFASIDFVGCEPNGSIWIGEVYIGRIVHIDNNFNYINEVSAFDFIRSVQVDQNDPTALFLGDKEFKINYPASGVPTFDLVAEWSRGVSLDDETKFGSIATLSNGIRYGCGGRESNPNLYKFTPQGCVLLDGNFPYDMQGDGSIYKLVNHNNEFVEVQKATIVSFEANGKPIYSDFTKVITSPATNSYTPWFYYNDTRYINSNLNYFLFYNCWLGAGADNQNPTRIGFVAGAMRYSDNKVMWQSAQVTTPDYQDDIPENGDFSIGAAMGHSNTRSYIKGDFMHYNVNTELSAYGQSNLWNVIHIPTGLHVQQYGTTGKKGGAALAGNALYNAVVKVAGKTYTFCADESVSGGALCIRTDNEESISVQEIDLLLERPVVPVVDLTDISATLPYHSVDFKAGNDKWFVNALTAESSIVRTSYFTYKESDIDLYVGGNGKQVMRGFLSNQQRIKWQLSSDILFDSEPTISDQEYSYFEVLDQGQRIIARFQCYADTNPANYYHSYIKANNTILLDGDNTTIFQNGIRRYYKSIIFKAEDGALKVSYNSLPFQAIPLFEMDANILRPGFIRLNQSSNGNQYHAISIIKIKFS